MNIQSVDCTVLVDKNLTYQNSYIRYNLHIIGSDVSIAYRPFVDKNIYIKCIALTLLITIGDIEMKKCTTRSLFTLVGLSIFSGTVLADDDQDDVQDMSDPLAVYTQAGAGYTDKGLNLKIGQTYDTGSDITMGMNVIEIKGIAGEAVGWNGDARANNDDSIDLIRFRNFSVDLTNGRGAQIDVDWNFDRNQGSASYSFIQALPKMGPVSLYPLAGLGLAAGESYDVGDQGAAQAQDRYDLHGSFYVAGLYSKIEVTDKIWINYNPMYLGTISGSDEYKNNAYGVDNDAMLTHEAAISYQITKRSNIRYFANWTEDTHFADGDHRIEFNYQF